MNLWKCQNDHFIRRNPGLQSLIMASNVTIDPLGYTCLQTAHSSSGVYFWAQGHCLLGSTRADLYFQTFYSPQGTFLLPSVYWGFPDIQKSSDSTRRQTWHTSGLLMFFFHQASNVLVQYLAKCHCSPAWHPGVFRVQNFGNKFSGPLVQLSQRKVTGPVSKLKKNADTRKKKRKTMWTQTR